MFYSVVFLLISQLVGVLCNTEKAIFLGPSTLQIPDAHPTLADLQLDTLSPESLSLRTYINAAFLINATKHGPATWVLLNNLEEGRRYEVRVCWAATQPTSFNLKTHELATVFENPKLITSLAHYAETRHHYPVLSDDQQRVLSDQPVQRQEQTMSMLFLQIFAAADYYTANKLLMKQVPSVYVDIILDPFLFNILPMSLLPTTAYMILLAIGGYLLSRCISSWMQTVSQGYVSKRKRS